MYLFRNPVYRISTPCQRFAVQYYADLTAPDEESQVDDFVLDQTLDASMDAHGVQVLHVCDPKRDGYPLPGFQALVKTTSLAQLKTTLRAWPRYHGCLRLSSAVDEERRRCKEQRMRDKQERLEAAWSLQYQRAEAERAERESTAGGTDGDDWKISWFTLVMQKRHVERGDGMEWVRWSRGSRLGGRRMAGVGESMLQKNSRGRQDWELTFLLPPPLLSQTIDAKAGSPGALTMVLPERDGVKKTEREGRGIEASLSGLRLYA